MGHARAQLVWLSVAAGLLATAPSAAMAGTLERLGGGDLKFTGTGSEENHLDVGYCSAPSCLTIGLPFPDFEYSFDDSVAITLAPGLTGCDTNNGGNVVYCDDNFDDLHVAFGGGNDSLDVFRGTLQQPFGGVPDPLIVNGGTGVDDLDGSHQIDRIDGDEGDDTIRGFNGDDTIEGNADDDDLLDGGSGNDTINGEGESTTPEGGDVIVGGTGNDIIGGQGGGDTITPGAGSDTVSGGTETSVGDRVLYDDGRTAGVTVTLADSAFNDGGAADQVAGGNRDRLLDIEHVTGTGFADSITGDGHTNSLSGGAGEDALAGAGGSDTLLGSSGDDRLDGGLGGDGIDGGSGTDRVDYSARSEGIAVTANAVSNDDGGPTDGAAANDRDTVNGIETVLGGSGSDNLTADPALGTTIVGNGGNDVLTGGTGADSLNGGPGGDAMNGLGGTDVISYAGSVNPLTVRLNQGSGDDGGAADGPAGARDTTLAAETVVGGSGSDRLVGDAGPNRLDGATGADVLQGLAGTDALNGGAGADTASYEERTAGVNVSLDGAANDGAAGENDAVGADVENVAGGAGPDTLTGGDGSNRLDGGGGADTIVGRAGIDQFFGGAGDDNLESRDGTAELVDCGAGNDRGNADGNDTAIACEAVLGIDADRDGFALPQDCNDANPTINPGALDRPGNQVDEDCKGGPARYRKNGVSVKVTWVVIGGRTSVARFIVRDIPRRSRLDLRCRGGGCAFRRIKKRYRGARKKVSLVKAFKRRALRPGARIVIRVTTPEQLGHYRQWRIRRAALPKDREACLTPGRRTPRRCPS